MAPRKRKVRLSDRTADGQSVYLAHSSKPVPLKQRYTNDPVRSYGAWTVLTCEAPQALQGSVFGFGIGTMLLAGFLYLG